MAIIYLKIKKKKRKSLKSLLCLLLTYFANMSLAIGFRVDAFHKLNNLVHPHLIFHRCSLSHLGIFLWFRNSQRE